MTQFTSFVAVEEMVVTEGGQPRRIDVPVEVPEGVNRQTTYGDESLNFVRGGRAYQGTFANAPMGITQTVTVTSSGANNSVGTTAGGIVTLPPVARSGRPLQALPENDKRATGRVPSPEEQKRIALQSKFHPAVLLVIDRLKARNPIAGADEAKFIHNDKAEIQIWFTDKSDEAMAKLKELGFEIILNPKTAKMVVGRLPIEKLAALAEMQSIRYVAPQTGN
jgi:hypothetical protein